MWVWAEVLSDDTCVELVAHSSDWGKWRGQDENGAQDSGTLEVLPLDKY